MTYSQEEKITVAHKFLRQEIDRDLAYLLSQAFPANIDFNSLDYIEEY